MKTLLFILIPIFSFSQSICDIPTDDHIKIFDTIFLSNDFAKEEVINLRNNFFVSCVRFKNLNEKIKVKSGKTLFKELTDDYYTIEKIQFSGNSAIVFIIQRKNSFFFTITLIKDGDWKIINYTKLMGHLKTDDFLYNKISEKIRKKKEK